MQTAKNKQRKNLGELITCEQVGHSPAGGTFTTMRFLSGPGEQLHGRLKAVIIIIKSSLMEIILTVSVLDRTVSMFSISFEFKVLN